MSVVTRQPQSNTTPDQVGTLAVEGISNTGHTITTASVSVIGSAPFGSDSDSQDKTARWSNFQGVGASIVSAVLKFDWEISGNAAVDDGGDGGVASSSALVSIEYSVNGGSGWTGLVSDSCSGFAPGIGGDSFSSSGSVSQNLTLPVDITQVQVKDSMTANASATGGESLDATASADASITISNIEIEITTSDGGVIILGF